MANTPWTVQRSKRKQPTTTPASRKRVRISDDVGESRARGSRPKGQKTLTQIQWVKNPETSFDDDSDLQEIPMEQGRSASPIKRKTPALKKRDSTLTQMDWSGGFHVHQDDTMDTTEILPEREENVGTVPVPQLDGAYDSPRKQKKPKSDIPQKFLRTSSPASPERETQNYRPTARPKKMASTARRKSSRIASKILTDPEENFQYMNDALLPATEQLDKLRSPQRQPPLEIQESVDFGVEYLPPHIPRPPATPRHHYEIRSSQTPETLTRTTRRKVQKDFETSPSKSVGRAPLAEKSANTILNAHSGILTKPRSPQKSLKRSPKRTKVCVLKVPSRDLLKKTARVEDSQRDIYSLQGTSSESDPSRHSDDMIPLKSPIPHETQTHQAVEIPPTSQARDGSDRDMPSSPPVVETDDSLPELSELLSSRRLKAALVTHERLNEASSDGLLEGDNSVIVRDFGRTRAQEIHTAVDLPNERHDHQKVSTTDDMLLDGEAVPAGHLDLVPSVMIAPGNGTDDDFGSPIANDTQFNFGLLNRTSSPELALVEHAGEVQSKHTSIQEHTTPTRSHRPDASAELGEDAYVDTETPIPTPRLVGRPTSSSFLTQPSQMLINRENAMLPPSFHLNHQHALAKVPLNDLQHISSSSSPLLPPVKSTTQRSVHPASMPRPSQMSTQEPTQNDFLSSSMPNLTQHQTQTERITIKDSDSVRLSQIPQHVSQSQAHDLRPINDSDDDMDDLDLDPSSTVHRMQSARKPSALSRKETGSSLRSIHPPSDPLRNRLLDLTSSSSPLLPPATSHRLGRIGPVSTIKPSTIHPPETSMATNNHDLLYDSDATTSSPISSLNPSPLKKKYDPIPGFDNETQSDFTQNGHITAAYIHRQREEGAIPEWFTPDPMQIEGAARRSAKRKRT